MRRIRVDILGEVRKWGGRDGAPNGTTRANASRTGLLESPRGMGYTGAGWRCA